MNKSQWAAIILVPAITGLTVSGFVYELAGPAPVQAKVVSINSWQGSDVQTYYNVTVSYHGHLYTNIIKCDYYHINSTLPITFSFSGAFLSFSGIEQNPGQSMPIGC